MLNTIPNSFVSRNLKEKAIFFWKFDYIKAVLLVYKYKKI